MYVLGIGGLGYKDSAAAILADGRPLAAVAEERFTGAKHQGGFPHRALRFCLERAGISLREVQGESNRSNCSTASAAASRDETGCTCWDANRVKLTVVSMAWSSFNGLPITIEDPSLDTFQ